MSDGDRIATLIKLGSDSEQLQNSEHAAAKKLLAMDGEVYPSDGCAITQSCLLQAAGIAVPDTFLAISFGTLLEKRGWARIAVGQQRAGDIGSTCKAEPDHGNDHVYLVLRVVSDDEMVIADNQATAPHFRFASGKGGKTPTTHFLRAPPAMASASLSGPTNLNGVQARPAEAPPVKAITPTPSSAKVAAQPDDIGAAFDHLMALLRARI